MRRTHDIGRHQSYRIREIGKVHLLLRQRELPKLRTRYLYTMGGATKVTLGGATTDPDLKMITSQTLRLVDLLKVSTLCLVFIESLA